MAYAVGCVKKVDKKAKISINLGKDGRVIHNLKDIF